MFLKALNPTQLEAATFGEGPLLILAGAGSGKTRVLTARIAHLVINKGVGPGRILAVTFTNKAAGEMRERLFELIGARARELWLGTFHSLGLRLLRTEAASAGVTPELTVYGDDEQLMLVKDVMGRLSINEKSTSPRTILSRINQAKNENIGPAEFLNYGRDFLTERVGRIYSLYQQRLREMNCRDFGDLICDPITLLQNNAKILEKYRERFRFVLVDEYQDTNRAQYILTQLLSSGYRNLFAVGDPDQSIYAWRGADISNILDFEKDYSDATVLRLEQNYRSTRRILTAANCVIRCNSRRMEKDLWTENRDGEPILYEQARDERAEARSVIRRIRETASVEPSINYGDVAVFYRTNAQSRVLEEELIREGMPYTIVGGVKFYDRREIRDAIAYLRVAANPGDEISLKRVINTPARGIGKVTFEKVAALSAANGLALFDAFAEAHANGMLAKTRIRALMEAYESFKADREKMELHERTLRLLEDSGYIMMWQEEGTEEAFERVENIFEFISAIRDFESANPGASLSDFLDHIALISDIDGYDDNPERVTLMTIHSAKGLEFKVVFVVGMEEGLFPHSRSIDDPEGIEEERRLCYVGMTRAKERLYLCSARTRTIYGETRYQIRSRFIDEIPQEHLSGDEGPGYGASAAGMHASDEPYYTTDDSQVFYSPDAGEDAPAPPSGSSQPWRVGMKVKHPSFGVGVIKERSGAGADTKLTVKFQHAGVRKLAVKYASLVPLG